MFRLHGIYPHSYQVPVSNMTKELLLQSCLEGKTFINNQRYTEIFIELSLYLLQHIMEQHPYIFKIILIRSEQQRIITQIHSSVECAGWLVLILNRYITEVEAVRWRVLWRILKILQAIFLGHSLNHNNDHSLSSDLNCSPSLWSQQ